MGIITTTTTTMKKLMTNKYDVFDGYDNYT